MPRPASKDQLLAESDKEYTALQKSLDNLTVNQMTDLSVVGDWTVKDVLAHLMAWGEMCLDWYQIGKGGENPQTPAEGYTWREIPRLNQFIYEKYRDTPLDDVQQQFKASHQAMMNAIQSMTDEELFTTKYYQWTKSTTLGSYLTSATCSHYKWARTEIRKGVKAQLPK